MLYNAVANEGTMMKPYLVNEVQKSGLVNSSAVPEVVEKQIASDKTIKLLQEMPQRRFART
jgi:cell division protein FtsI (penicillin-binding protein 3)